MLKKQFFSSTRFFASRSRETREPLDRFTQFRSRKQRALGESKVYQSDWTNFFGFHGLWRPIVFTGAFASLAFHWSALHTEEQMMKQRIEKLKKEEEEGIWGLVKTRFLGLETPNAHRHIQPIQIPQQPTNGAWSMVPQFVWKSYIMAENRWKHASTADKTILGIVVANVGIWALWQIPKLQVPMSILFMHYPPASRTSTMLTSSFSHIGLAHLAFNMLAFSSFSSDVIPNIMDGNSSEFLAFYLTAAVFSSCTSSLNAARNVRMGLTARDMVQPSVGASGGVYAIVAAVAALYPQTKVHVMLIPYALPLGNVFPVLMMMDLAGLLLRWRTFDHAAHLGGALFGIWYVKGGGREWYLRMRDRYRSRLLIAQA